ncbi:MAG: hypothetical protein QM516_00205, partial [Limnohabitans sp.]|nr:hypothetical protein [Limnohabitans sp.]
MSNLHRLPRWTRRGRITFATASVFILVTLLVTQLVTQLLPVARAAQDAAQQATPTKSADQSGDVSRDGSGASTVDLPQIDPSTDTSDAAEAPTTASPT